MVIIIMGVCGTGKTTVGELLARRLGFEFAEGDAYHPQANVAKMRSGQPLDDTDRAPWLAAMAVDIDMWLARERNAVLACSALKRSYRDTLIGERKGVRLVYLFGAPDLIRQRMEARTDHYMPSSLLDSQLATLQEPGDDEHPISIDVDGAPERLVEQVLAQL